jgi:hypothetical protein
MDRYHHQAGEELAGASSPLATPEEQERGLRGGRVIPKTIAPPRPRPLVLPSSPSSDSPSLSFPSSLKPMWGM